MVIKKRHGSMKSSVPSQISVQIKGDNDCKISYSDTKILVVIESIAGFEGGKGKGKHDVKYPLEMLFRVSLGEEILGMSDMYVIPSTEKFDINYNTVYLLPVDPSQVLVSQPLTITAFNAGAKDKRKSSSRGTRASMMKQSLKISPGSSDNQIFEATVDLLPLVFGEIEIEQKVADSLEVLVRLDGAKLKVPKNLLYVTLQNLHNPPLELISSDIVGVTASIHCMKPPESDEESQDSEWYKMDFGPALVTSLEAGLEGPIKRWFSVQTGPPVLSQYRNIPDKELVRDVPRLSVDSNRSIVYLAWNQIKRIFLDSNQQEKLLLSLIEKSEWLLEIMVKHGKKSEQKQKGKSNVAPKAPENEKNESVLYQVKLDMAELLHPGVNCCKIVGQLEPIQKVIVEPSMTPLANSPQSANSEVSHISQKNQKNVSNSTTANQEDDTMSPWTKTSVVQDFHGRRSYITVFVELYSSFLPRKTHEQLLLNLNNFIRKGVEECPESDVSSPFQAQLKYKTCLLDNVKCLNDLYLEFFNQNHCNKNDEDKSTEHSSTFKEELEKTGTLDCVKRSLSEAITSLLKDTSCDLQHSGLCEAYCKIVEETHGVLEEASQVDVPGPQIRATSDELLLAAREASEENDYNQAEEYLLKRMYYYGKKDADNFRDLAVLCLRHGHFSKAKQTLFSALCIQPRHRDSLLMLAVLLSTEGKNSDASLIFEALTTFYPRFYKGWFTYCCFYNSIENKQGADVCLSLGSVCLNDKERDDGKVLSTYWSSEVLNQDDGFLLTAAHLLSLNLTEYAEMCLSNHRLEAEEDTVAYLYFVAVAHHLQGKYKESSSHLKQALSISWNDEKLWNLMGHNLYRLGDFGKAVDCYKVFLNEAEPIQEYSLTFYRMGKISLQNFEYEPAIDYYLRAVSLSPSLKSWIGLAKSSYWAGKIEDAELAAREANRLDDRSSEPWACLALVNLQNCPHPQLARHCLSLAAQCGDIDNELLKEINQILDSYQEIPMDFPNAPSSGKIKADS